MLYKAITIMLLFMVFMNAYPMDVEIPVSIQVPLFVKILSFDRHMKTGTYQDITIVVIYQKGYKASLNIKNEIQDIVGASSIRDIDKKPLVFKSLALSDPDDLDKYLHKNKTDVIIAAPLRAIDMARLKSIFHEHKVLSMSTVPDYVYDGFFSVGIDIKGEKPIPVIHLENSRQEGSDLSSQLLKLSKVVQ